MTDNPINGLDAKIASLGGVDRKKSNDGTHDIFSIDGKEFVKYLGKGQILLKLADGCRAKLDSALKSEPRASFSGMPEGWVKLTFASDVDMEFVFLYVRFAWKYLRAEQAA